MNNSQSLSTACACCRRKVEPRDPDPWEGRLDDYCEDCATARCDAYPGDCGKPKEYVDPLKWSGRHPAGRHRFDRSDQWFVNAAAYDDLLGNVQRALDALDALLTAVDGYRPQVCFDSMCGGGEHTRRCIMLNAAAPLARAVLADLRPEEDR